MQVACSKFEDAANDKASNEADLAAAIDCNQAAATVNVCFSLFSVAGAAVMMTLMMRMSNFYMRLQMQMASSYWLLFSVQDY